MSSGMANTADVLRLRLPATSANLGPGFDTAAVALDFHLEVEAEPASEFSISATGRNRDRCGRLTDNLVLDLYRKLLADNGKPLVPLAIRMDNQIPLGMGCGSSAAGRLAAISLATHFGRLGWESERILEEASKLEGHPDNAAACWLGGFVATAYAGTRLHVARVVPPDTWRAIVVVPPESLATSKARAVLPASYSRSDAVTNLQSVAILGLAFAQARGDLLSVAMRDRIHQPYREAICPQLPRLLPLAGHDGILGVALSGAGPSVLVITDGAGSVDRAAGAIRASLKGMPDPELVVCQFESQGVRSTTGATPFAR